MTTKATESARNGKARATVDAESFQPITIERLERSTIEVPIIGLTPLIPHRWDEKARQMLRDKQGGKTMTKRAPKDALADATAATYWLSDGQPGMPATAFKAAIADAARFYDKSVAATHLKQIVHVQGEGPEQLVPVAGDYEMFESMPRNSGLGSNVDLRYRNRLWPWSAVLLVTYITSQITAESLVNLIDAAGNGGVGDWRPSSPKSRTGTYGQFRVEEGT